MFPSLPEDVIDSARAAFAEANERVTELLLRQPAMHEEGLDFQLVSSLDAVGPQVLSSGSALAIETHWLGGRRHWGRWEISDIAIVVTARISGSLLSRKVALLQTKRLYTRELPISELERADYEIGIGRLIDRVEPSVPLFKQRKFSFDSACVYGALSVASEQVRRIDEYVAARDIPVYYAMYNPPMIPITGLYPRRGDENSPEENQLGCRVMTREEVHGALQGMPIGSTPSFSNLSNKSRQTSFDAYAVNGWRLENFVADEVMRCREGRLFDYGQDEVLGDLLYRRTAPIAAAVVITVDVPDGELRYYD